MEYAFSLYGSFLYCNGSFNEGIRILHGWDEFTCLECGEKFILPVAGVRICIFSANKKVGKKKGVFNRPCKRHGLMVLLMELPVIAEINLICEGSDKMSIARPSRGRKKFNENAIEI